MSKLLSFLLAVGVLWMISLTGPAGAAQRGAVGIGSFDQYEFSAARKRRYVRRYYAPRYYVQPNYYYRTYPYQPYGYYRPVPPPFFPFFPFFPFIR